MHYTVLRTCNVLFPYILSISKDVGGIWEQSRREAWTIISFKKEWVCLHYIRGYHDVKIYLLKILS